MLMMGQLERYQWATVADARELLSHRVRLLIRIPYFIRFGMAPVSYPIRPRSAAHASDLLSAAVKSRKPPTTPESKKLKDELSHRRARCSESQLKLTVACRHQQSSEETDASEWTTIICSQASKSSWVTITRSKHQIFSTSISMYGSSARFYVPRKKAKKDH